MDRLDLMQPLAFCGYACASVLLPAHQWSPENLQDPVRVRNLVGQATSRLVEEFGKQAAADVVKRPEEATLQ